jgi:protein-disulfide isomerase
MTTMPSGKRNRRRRHEPPARVPSQPSPPGPRKASPKVLLGAAAVAIVAAIAIVLAVTLGGGSPAKSSSVPAVGRLAGGLPGAAEVERLLEGIPQKGNALGAADAPVTMVEYVDLQCPYCREFDTAVLPQLIRRYVRPGELRIETRLLAFIGPDSRRGRAAALAAGEQQRLSNFAELLFFNQGTENTGWLDEQMVESAAASIPGLGVQKLLDARSSAAVTVKAAALDAEAKASGVDSTPTIMVGRTGSTPTRLTLGSPTDGETVVAAIEDAAGR